MAEPINPGITNANPHGSRRSLLGLAYRLLGSVEEAEDVVQDAHLRMLGTSRAPDNPDAYLFRTVTNLAIDRLRHLKVQRRAYIGPWLPEPLATAPAEARDPVALEDSLSVGFLLVLERLSVSERAAFVLREAFDLSFNEMSHVLGVTPVACRQRFHRARRKLAGARPANVAPSSSSRSLQRQRLERLIDAVSAADHRRVAALLTDDALLLTDGGGRASAAIRPVEDPRRIAQVIVHLATRDDITGPGLEFRDLNGGVGLLVTVPGADGARPAVYASIQVELDGEQISRIYVMRNPDKLGKLSRALQD